MRKPADAFESVDLRAVIQNADICHREDDVLAGRGVQRLHAANLDVLLNLTGGPKATIDPIPARYGVWSLHLSESGAELGRQALADVVGREVPTMPLEVRACLPENGSPRVLGRGLAQTVPLSLHRSRAEAFGEGSALLLRCLRALHESGWEALSSEGTVEEPAERIAPDRAGKTDVRALFQWSGKALSRAIHRLLGRSQWLLAVSRKQDAVGTPGPGAGFRLIVPPRNHCYADPFLYQKDGRNYVFFEEYRYDKPKGVISVAELDDTGRFVEPRVVLEKDHHLSYPFVFDWEGEIYLMPETAGNRTVEVHRAVHFPDRWAPAQVLLDNVSLLDPTLLHYQGMLWLFANPRWDHRRGNDELALYFSPTLEGPWRPHPRNPIVTGVHQARPAGRLFSVGEQLYRPAQDCSRRYGYAVAFQRVDVLSENEYREVPIGRLEPSWLPGNLATHTFNFNDDLIVVDAQREIGRFGGHTALSASEEVPFPLPFARARELSVPF
jgi:hypothetical protein